MDCTNGYSVLCFLLLLLLHGVKKTLGRQKIPKFGVVVAGPAVAGVMLVGLWSLFTADNCKLWLSLITVNNHSGLLLL